MNAMTEMPMNPIRKETLESIVVQSAEAARPPERLTVAEAAEKYRKINNPGAFVGDWSNSKTPYLVEPMNLLNSTAFTSMIFVGPAQCGKSLCVETPIATPHGWKRMGDICVGDYVFGSDGKPTRVVIANPVQHERPCFLVEFDEGTSIVADADHRWFVEDVNRSEGRVLTTQEIVDNGVCAGKRARYSIPNAKAVELPEKELPMDPYVLGVWLGDGSELYGYVSCGREDAEAMALELSNRGYKSTTYKPSALHRCYSLGVRGPDGVFIDQYLSNMGLGGGKGKSIPEEYLRASVEQRKELLRGLCDTDGCLSGTHKRAVQFVSVDESLARQVAELAISLGHKARLRFKEGPGRGSWNVLFSIYDGAEAFSLPRKRNLPSKTGSTRIGETSRRFIRSVTQVPSVPVRCIGVDADDHLFLAGTGMVPTHNTDMAMNWIGFSAKCDPADMMVICPSNTTARDFSMRRVDRLHRHSKDFGDQLIQSRDADNVFDKHYKSGMMLTLSWPTINELSGKPIPRLWLTDYDRMDQDVDKEGDPFSLARKRATTFKSFGMTVAESSPGFEVEDPGYVPTTPHEAIPTTDGIIPLYNNGDRRRWYWRCVNPKCGRSFEPDFDLLRYPDSADAMESAEQAELACPHCDTRYPHDAGGHMPGKHEMNLGGRWVKDGQVWLPDGTMRGVAIRSTSASFWLKGVAAAFATWKTLVFNYIVAERTYEANGSEKLLKSTINTDQGKPYIPKSLASLRSPETIKAKAKSDWLGKVPVGVRFLTAAIDVQKNRFVVQVMGVAMNGDRYLIDRFDIRKSKRKDEDGDSYWVNPGAYPEDWKILGEEVLGKTYPLNDDSGRHMQIKFTVCDSGGKDGVTMNAYDFYRWLRRGDEDEIDTAEEQGEYTWSQEFAGRFLLLKGSSNVTAPQVEIRFPDSQRKDRNAGARGEIPVMFINTNMAKDTLNNALDREDPGGRINFPIGLADSFYTELTVEVKDMAKGWINPKRFRNESWDLFAYHYATCLLPFINFKSIHWEDPPGWAAEWDQNDLVFHPVTENKPFDAAPKKKYDLAALAKNLG